jgi:hypothetical protein
MFCGKPILATSRPAPDLNLGAISHVLRPVPLCTPPGTIFFANGAACDPQQTLLRLQIQLKSEPLPEPAHRLLSLPLLRSPLSDVFSAHFAVLISLTNAVHAPALQGFPGLREMHPLPPTVKHVVSRFAFLLRPAALPALPLPCFLRLFFLLAP